MKFLIDRCAGRRLANWLLAQGHDAVHVVDLGRDPGDAVLLAMAFQQQRIFVTIDTDFGTLIFRDALDHCGIVRLPDVPAEQRIALMEQVLAKHAADLAAKAIITIRGNRVRITHSPPPPTSP